MTLSPSSAASDVYKRQLKDVPCVVLRVVSDTPGATDDNMTQYMNFSDAAPGCTFDAVNTLLSNL